MARITQDAGKDFEKQLIADGFSDEIKQTIIDQHTYCNEQHEQAKVRKIEKYDDKKLYEIITGNKTQYGPAIAEQIIRSNKALPPKVIDLFDKVTAVLRKQESEI